MKNINILGLFIILFFAIQYNLPAKNLLPSGNDKVLMEYNSYLKTVNLDGGKILNKDLLNKFIQLSTEENWYDNIKFWVSAQWGLKEYDGLISKQYGLKGEELTTPITEKRPKKIMDGNLFGISYDGEKDFSENLDVKVQQPLSMLLVFSGDKNTGENFLVDAKGDKSCQISIEKNNAGESELLIKSAGEIRVKGLVDGINIVYIEFNLKNSKVFINGQLAFTGIIGKVGVDGLVIGKGNINNKVNYFKGVMYETGIINNYISDEARTGLFNLMKEIYK
jgi:hypothetical protein